MDDRFGLERFVSAQDSGRTYERAVGELRQGHKTSHWMWFVFPQVAGLGRSQMSQHYAISSLDEAKAYLTHPVLAPPDRVRGHRGRQQPRHGHRDFRRHRCAETALEHDAVHAGGTRRGDIS